jgi:hypothetical protein
MLSILLALAPGLGSNDPAPPPQLVDLDGDGRTDLVDLAGGRLQVSWSLGGRSFERATNLPAIPVADVLVDDLDADGRLDLYLVSPGANLALVADGARGFRDATDELGLADAGVGLRVERRDVDGDGVRDLVLHEARGVVIFWGHAEGGFERDLTLAPPAAPRGGPVVGPRAEETPAVAPPPALEGRGDGTSPSDAPRPRAGSGPPPAPGSRRPVPGYTITPGGASSHGGAGPVLHTDLPPDSLILWEGPTPPPGFEPTGWTVQVEETENWSWGPSMAQQHYGAASAALAGKLFVFGGYDTSAGHDTSVEVYDPKTQTWSSAAAMPKPMSYAASAAVGGKAYLFGGNDGVSYLTDVWEYDPGSDNWTQKSSMPASQNLAACGEVGGRVYLIGGWNGTTNIGIVQEYDVATDAWTTRSAALPLPRRYAIGGAAGGKVAVVGGYTTSAVGTVDVYDPVTDSFSSGAPTSAMYGSTTVSMKGEIVVLSPLSGGYTNWVRAYDPISDTWRNAIPSGQAHYLGAAEVLDDRIHLAGGYYGAYTNTLEIYTPTGPALQVVRKK